MRRTKYSPYEADWWKWTAHRVGGGHYEATPQVKESTTSLLPVILTHAQIAKDISNLIDSFPGSQWVWRIADYSVIRLDLITFDLPDEWHDVLQDNVLDSEEEQEDATSLAASFMRVAKPKPKPDPSSSKPEKMKRVLPGLVRNSTL